jgi:hypothetical protein
LAKHRRITHDAESKFSSRRVHRAIAILLGVRDTELMGSVLALFVGRRTIRNEPRMIAAKLRICIIPSR